MDDLCSIPTRIHPGRGRWIYRPPHRPLFPPKSRHQPSAFAVSCANWEWGGRRPPHPLRDRPSDGYMGDFWNRTRCDALATRRHRPDGVLDRSPSTPDLSAGRALQLAVGHKRADIDGAIGPDTLGRVALADTLTLLDSLAAMQRTSYRQMAAFGLFGDDWLARLDRRRAKALELGGDGGTRQPAVIACTTSKPSNSGWLQARACCRRHCGGRGGRLRISSMPRSPLATPKRCGRRTAPHPRLPRPAQQMERDKARHVAKVRVAGGPDRLEVRLRPANDLKADSWR